MVIQKTKKFFFFNHTCIIITFIYLSKSIIKSCINEPVEHFNHVLSPNFEFLCPKLKKRRWRSFLIRFLAYWGISVVKTANEVSKDCPKGGVHLQRLARDATICFAWILYSCTHFNKGNPPTIPQYTIWRQCVTWRSESRQRKFRWRLSLTENIIAICHGQLYQTDKASFQQKKARPREFQKSGLVLRRMSSYLNQTPGAKGMPKHKEWWGICTSYEYRCSQEKAA